MTNIQSAQNEQQHTIVLPDQTVTETPRRNSSRFASLFSRFKRKPKVVTNSATVVKKKGFKPWQKVLLGILVVVLIFGAAGGAMAWYTYDILMDIKADASEVQTSANVLKEKLKTQDLPGAKTALADTKTKFEALKQEFNRLSYFSAIPVASAYYNDGVHGFAAGDAGIRAAEKTIDAIVPYADVLGFSGEGSFTGGTAEERVRLLLETVSKISPILDDITKELNTAETELAQINPNRYPEKVGDVEVRSLIAQAQTGIVLAVDGINTYRPAIEVLPELAGSNKQRKKYLVLFQNDNELRPTGGFLTAYAVMFVEDGKVYPEKSDDIYELDKKFKKNIPIPPVLGKYLTSEKRFNLRDMNVSPDFRESMKEFYTHFREVPGEPDNIDGIIALDTNVLSDLVKILGPVEVPGYGTFSAENDPKCDCPQIIYAMSEIVDRPTPYIREDRKGIIAPMMQAIIQKAYSSPKEMWPGLFKLAMEKIEGKHVQMYMFDEEHQKAAEAINAAGLMNPSEEGQDYIAIVDANLGGAKSNLFVEQSVKLEVSPVENGMITNTLTLNYKNPRKGDNCNLEAGLLCLNGILNDWVRVYLPDGAKLVEAQGFSEGTQEETTDLGFSVIEGAFKVAPLSSATVKITYTVPYTNEKEYAVKLRKQGGTDKVPYLISVNGNEHEEILDKDKVVKVEY